MRIFLKPPFGMLRFFCPFHLNHKFQQSDIQIVAMFGHDLGEWRPQRDEYETVTLTIMVTSANDLSLH